MIGRSDPLETLGIGRWVASGAPEGFDALAIAQFATRRATPVIHIARDAARMAELEDALGFFAPDISVLSFPAWDCLPYDRVSPSVDVVSQRVACLSALAERVDTEPSPSILLTTVSAALQRVPPRAALATGTFSIRTGESLDVAALQSFLEHNGYHRTGTVRETGEFALRGGILDLFPAGAHDPLRVDLFGDQVESLKRFDPMSQRSAEAVDQLILRPAGEVTLDRDSIARFRTRYLQAFGAVRGEDPLYEAVSAGRRSGGIEHWLPFFHDRLETLFDYLPGAAVMLDHFVEDAVTARQDLIADHYAARLAFLDKRDDGGGAPYKPVNPELLYIDTETFAALASERTVVEFAPYDAPDGASSESQIDLAARPGRDFAEARKRPDISLFEELGQHIGSEQQAGRRVLIACYSTGSRERLAGLMHDGGLEATAEVDRLTQLEGLEAGMVGLAVLPIQRGFCTNSLSVITEQDILGDRLVRRQQKRRGSEQFIAEASQLSVGDLVTHVDHGIGRFNGLVTIEVTGAPHDCLRLIYAGDDKLFVPVENLEVLSRFGSEDMGVPLDRLGQGQWQARKAKVKERIRE
ncbi:MAG: CarD family transcriptional regulator, partial [Alphaproteobacteria bacterium]|nr:CarD family transcriptional regulator [Alphaproteobacteria bacterium]